MRHLFERLLRANFRMGRMCGGQSGKGQWVIAVPLTFLTALVFNAPVAVVCLCIQSENVCKCPWGILRLRSRKWINDVTGEDT